MSSAFSAPGRVNRMGSSGMKRKGRRHLPKVGSPKQIEHSMHDRETVASHPFSEHPLSPRKHPWGAIGILVGLFAIVGGFALILFT